MSAVEIKTPVLGESVSEATVAKWYKQPGEGVQKDELLVELETDKVTLEVNALESGTLKEIKAGEGDTVEVDDLLGLLEAGAAPEANDNKDESSPAAKKEEPKQEAAPNPVPTTASAPAAAGGKGAEGAGPAARKLINENNLDASKIQGSGKDGRLTKGDVLAALESGSAKASDFNADDLKEIGLTSEGKPRQERVRMTKLRQTIAKRLKESQNTAAMLTTFNEVDMTNVMGLRKEFQEQFVEQYGVKLGFMSLFTKAAVQALKELPAVNAEIDGDEIVYKNHYDVGMAVGTPQGLVVPVIRDCDTRNFAEIEQEIGRMAKLAREGKLEMSDLTGGTFTITNGGVYGSMLSTPIINPPQSGILGLHNITKRAVVMPDGSIQARNMMYIALSYDHRIIDGREAVTFLVRIKELIEDPRRLIFGI
jgi:2-oxoglutarate dehydrogenase E2 component (dihydrolipoamide succinyltransferase)